MKKDLPAKGSEWVRLILSGLVFLAFYPGDNSGAAKGDGTF